MDNSSLEPVAGGIFVIGFWPVFYCVGRFGVHTYVGVKALVSHKGRKVRDVYRENMRQIDEKIS